MEARNEKVYDYIAGAVAIVFLVVMIQGQLIQGKVDSMWLTLSALSLGYLGFKGDRKYSWKKASRLEKAWMILLIALMALYVIAFILA
ncbi:hypothetical protein OZX60_02000 [Streptococcaceae bacterium ESL0687]|nr:hypothetical protein OZX60_02000 [Streptococcaceae bacterium ESL0687]